MISPSSSFPETASSVSKRSLLPWETRVCPWPRRGTWRRGAARITGYQIGAVSVLDYRRRGQHSRGDLPACLDRQVLDLERAAASSGRPGMGLELAPQDLLRAIGAEVGDFAS
jgi:hypothetical protein